jgi:hypothetical protein
VDGARHQFFASYQHIGFVRRDQCDLIQHFFERGLWPTMSPKERSCLTPSRRSSFSSCNCSRSRSILVKDRLLAMAVAAWSANMRKQRREEWKTIRSAFG